MEYQVLVDPNIFDSLVYSIALRYTLGVLTLGVCVCVCVFCAVRTNVEAG